MSGWPRAWSGQVLTLHVIQSSLQGLNLSGDRVAKLSLILELLLQGQDLVSLTFFLQICKSVPKRMQRVNLLGLGKEIRGRAVPWIEDLLTHIFGVILHLNEWIFFYNINFGLLALIIFLKSLVNFVAEYQTESAI